MSTTYYHTIDGALLGQTTAGVRTDYMTDALGSVTGTTVSGTVENTYRYMPFGTLLAKTGSSSDPSFLWVGSQGYRAMQRSYSEYYVRLRHLSASSGSWTSLDIYWPDELGWGYASNNPTMSTDPSGALAATPALGETQQPWNVSCCGGFNSFIAWTGAPRKVGKIIQQITMNFTLYKSCPPQGSPKTEPTLTYFESWDVSASGQVTPIWSLANDFWRFNSQWLLPDHTWNIGEYQSQGIAIYVSGTPDGYSSFEKWNVIEAHGLMSTSNWPQWKYYLTIAALSGQVTTQSALYSWNCCCGCPPVGPPDPCFNKFKRSPSWNYEAPTDCGCPVDLPCSPMGGG